ncbi:MAG: hypothetical protein LBS83_01515 [Holosporales bacterium]|nr:hypothetical protein [Holosporales bacterium]
MGFGYSTQNNKTLGIILKCSSKKGDGVHTSHELYQFAVESSNSSPSIPKPQKISDSNFLD